MEYVWNFRFWILYSRGRYNVYKYIYLCDYAPDRSLIYFIVQMWLTICLRVYEISAIKVKWCIKIRFDMHQLRYAQPIEQLSSSEVITATTFQCNDTDWQWLKCRWPAAKVDSSLYIKIKHWIIIMIEGCAAYVNTSWRAVTKGHCQLISACFQCGCSMWNKLSAFGYWPAIFQSLQTSQTNRW